MQLLFEERRLDGVRGKRVIKRVLGHVLDEDLGVDVLRVVGEECGRGVSVRVGEGERVRSEKKKYAPPKM